MPTDLGIFDAALAGQIFTGMWGVIAASIVGVGVLLGATIGLKKLSKMINGAANGKAKLH